MGFKEFKCSVCGKSFTAYPAGNAVDGPYCSPRCTSVGMGYAELFETDELVDYLVEEADSVGEVTAERIIDNFGSAEEVLEAELGELSELDGVSEYRARSVLDALNDN